MRRSLKFVGFQLSCAALSFGCNQAGPAPASRTTTTTTTTKQTTPLPSTAPGVRVEAGPNGATATGQTAANEDGVDVNVGEDGGVNVDVQGEPIRDRIRERRAARDANLPR